VVIHEGEIVVVLLPGDRKKWVARPLWWKKKEGLGPEEGKRRLPLEKFFLPLRKGKEKF